MSAALAGRWPVREPTQSLPGETGRAIDAFEIADTLLMGCDRMRPFAGKWVAAYDGLIIAHADLHALVAELTAKGLPLGEVAIRFIENDGIAA